MKEKLLPYEKLQLATSQIQLMALQLTHLSAQLSGIPVCHELASQHYEALDQFAMSAIELMNDMADYKNNTDTNSKIDIKLFGKLIEELNK